MNLILIGYRGTGKSTVAQLLASRLEREILSTDAMVIEKAQMLIPEIVEKLGWDHFRDLESTVCQNLRESDNLVLDTGGGVANALPFLGGDAFLVLNSDVVILKGKTPLIQRLTDAWDSNLMDALLLLQPIENSFGYSGPGDFHLQTNGLLRRSTKGTYAPFLFTGVQMLKRSLFRSVPSSPFSLNFLYNRAQENGRLYGIIHDGEWLHVGTPDAMRKAEMYIRNLE